MKFELDFLPSGATDQDIFDHIRQIDSIVGKDFLTQKDFDSHSKIHSGTLVRRFGDWTRVLELAGLGEKYAGHQVTKKQRQQAGKYMKNEEIIDEIKRIAKALNKESITVEDVRKYSEIIAPELVRRRFGTWAAGMDIAGLKVAEKFHRKFSDEECFENLLNVWTHYGRQPVFSEMKSAPSEIGPDVYRRRFGGWRKALEAFVIRMNQDENGNAQQVAKNETPQQQVNIEIKRHSVAIADKRNIGLGLRYKVLSRDNFKCVRCGRSPATVLGVELHIDHKLPFSKGGKTILENLETKCKECNLGKSNRHVE